MSAPLRVIPCVTHRLLLTALAGKRLPFVFFTHFFLLVLATWGRIECFVTVRSQEIGLSENSQCLGLGRLSVNLVVFGQIHLLQSRRGSMNM